MRIRFLGHPSRAAATTLSIAALLGLAGTVSAVVLADKSEEQKLRKDIGKQQIKYVSCLAKAAVKCEGSGATIEKECDLSDGTATPPADAKGKFVADIAKCDSKLDFQKKLKDLTDTTGYTAIGCPGDSDNSTPNVDDPFASLSAWETYTQGPAGNATKAQIDAIAILLGQVVGPDAAVCGSEPPEDQGKCVLDLAKLTASYAKSLQTCIANCENDYKDKKGNGGGTDATTNCNLDAGAYDGVNTSGNALFNACVNKASDKADKKGGFPGSAGTVLIPNVHTALRDAGNDLYNQNDCP
jgi:hypothetical protein